MLFIRLNFIKVGFRPFIKVNTINYFLCYKEVRVLLCIPNYLALTYLKGLVVSPYILVIINLCTFNIRI